MIETRELTSLHYDKRPSGCKIDTIVIHSMYAKGSTEPFNPKSCWEVLNNFKVSAHFFIAKDGMIYRSVPTLYRAWHAGESQMPFPKDSRNKVNDFSIGIEMIGDEQKPFSEAQYSSLNQLVHFLIKKHLITSLVSHRAIAPGRKIDPWPNFDWNRIKKEFSKVKNISD